MKAKTTILAFAGAFSLACLQSVFPHLFTYRLCGMLCLGLFSLSLADVALSPLLSARPSRFSRYPGVLADAFPILLLLGITIFSVAALNEKIYAENSELHSIYWGFFTLGGFFPLNDNYIYLYSILSFLDEGVMYQMALFRPFPHLFSSVLYMLSGSEWLRFFHLSTSLLIVSIWCHGMVVARYAGRFIALFSSGLLCWYFARFQATFLTELTGGSLGMVAISILIYGYFERSLKAYAIGLVLIALAMQMRSGVILLLPLLVVVGGIRFRDSFRSPFLSYLSIAIPMIGALALPAIQNQLLRKPIPSQSNAAIFVHQVMRNADTWTVYGKEYPIKDPKGKESGHIGQVRRLAVGVKEELKRHPEVFVHNYLSMMVRYGPHIERYLMPWSDRISTLWACLVLVSFLWGFYKSRSGSRLRTLSLFLSGYLLCCFLGLPMLYEISVRFYAASISLNTLITAISIHNLLHIVGTFIQWVSGRHHFSKSIPMPFQESLVETPNVPLMPFRFIFPVLLILMTVLGPIVIDRLRNFDASSTPSALSWSNSPGSHLRRVDIGESPYVLLDPAKDFIVQDPMVIPRKKWQHDWVGAALPTDKTYMLLPRFIEPCESIDSGSLRSLSALMLPEKMLRGVKMSEIATLIIRTEDTPHIMPRTKFPAYYIVTDVLEIKFKSK